ncbi:MAG: hypothetical protein ABIN89_31190 [Chitinophagaceae bacterium]
MAKGPVCCLRGLTKYVNDEGQEITSLSLSGNGKWKAYVRGGEHSGNRDRSTAINPAFDPIMSKVQVWSVPLIGGKPILLSEGDYPAISPAGNKGACIR